MKLSPRAAVWLLDMLDMQEEQLSSAGPFMMGDPSLDDQEKHDLIDESIDQLAYLDEVREKVKNDQRRRVRATAVVQSLRAYLSRHDGGGYTHPHQR